MTTFLEAQRMREDLAKAEAQPCIQWLDENLFKLYSDTVGYTFCPNSLLLCGKDWKKLTRELQIAICDEIVSYYSEKGWEAEVFDQAGLTVKVRFLPLHPVIDKNRERRLLEIRELAILKIAGPCCVFGWIFALMFWMLAFSHDVTNKRVCLIFAHIVTIVFLWGFHRVILARRWENND